MFILITIMLILTIISMGFMIHTKKNLLGALSTIIILASLFLGTLFTNLISKHSIESQLDFVEYWNGFELEAVADETTCVRNGSCYNTYQCDPYNEIEVYYVTVSDGNGGTTQQMKTRTVTKYHSCPYSTKETSYYVSTTLKTKIDYGSHLMTGDRFRSGVAIRTPVDSPPKGWIEAKERIESNKPLGITKTNIYKNYILGTNDHIYGKDSSRINDYIDVLPKLNILNNEFARKFYPVGVDFDFAKEVSLLNGALGITGGQGDLHVVMIDSTLVDSPDDYVNALSAYWSDTKIFERKTLPKNAIVIVLGVNNSTVDWARGFTGMPTGNENLLHKITTVLPGNQINEHLFGTPYMNTSTKEGIPSDGLIENLLLTGDTRFERTSMSGDSLESGGFLYLKSSIEPTNSAIAIATIIWVILLLLANFCSYMMYNELENK